MGAKLASKPFRYKFFFGLVDIYRYEEQSTCATVVSPALMFL